MGAAPVRISAAAPPVAAAATKPFLRAVSLSLSPNDIGASSFKGTHLSLPTQRAWITIYDAHERCSRREHATAGRTFRRIARGGWRALAALRPARRRAGGGRRRLCVVAA